MALRQRLTALAASSDAGRRAAHVLSSAKATVQRAARPDASTLVALTAPRLSATQGSAESFTTDDGRVLPVVPGYRYATKPGWRFFQPLRDLAECEQRGLLDDSRRRFLAEARGDRTLRRSVPEIAEQLQEIAAKHRDYFLWPSATTPILKPAAEQTEATVARLVLRRQRQLRDAGVSARGGRLLEVGYTSGGHSLAAFARLGLTVSGVDNFYDGVVDASPMPGFVLHEQLRVPVRLEVGDITAPETLSGETFDVIFSESVIEHLADPVGFFTQMRRLLAPGGVIVHTYEPFFGERGAHALGITDSPFGHVRLTSADLARYIATLRPHEAPVAVPWVTGALNRITQGAVQRAVVNAGFRITRWSVDATTPDALDPAVVKEALAVHPDIDVADLCAHTVTLVAVAS